jgi:hypothetical protein
MSGMGWCGRLMLPIGNGSQIAEFAAAGVLAVEMQAASLFAFGVARHIPSGLSLRSLAVSYC